jgi:cytochrome c oxidase subunit 2
MIDRLLPIAASADAADLDAVLRAVHVHMAVQLIAWGLFFLYVLVRYRRAAQPHARYAGLKPLVPVLAIGAVIVGDALVLATSALPVWYARAAPPASSPPPLEVRVIAEQFAWNIHYPGPDGKFGRSGLEFISASNPVGIDRSDPDARDDIGLLNTLMLPIGRTVIVELTSRDVIHSFTLNEMRVRQDATPGLTVRTWFTPIVAGRWNIACSQLCGLGHYRMRGEYTVMTGEEWDGWMRAEVKLLSAANR